jgi:List-Bact-rpt repeat protein
MRRALPLRHIVPVLAIVALTGVAGVSAQPVAKRMLRASSDGNGAVVSLDRRLNCGARCSAKYEQGAVVSLRAVPRRFFSFDRWTGGCVGRAPRCFVVVDRSTAVRATFFRKFSDVSLSVGGPGTVVSEPEGLACGKSDNDCFQSVAAGTRITLSPAAASGGIFSAWSEACREAGQGPCTLVADDDVEVLAAFRHEDSDPDTPTLTVNPEGAHVTSEPAGIDCPPTCEASFPTGTFVTLRGAVSKWNGACVGSAGSCGLIVDASDGVGTGGPPPPPPPKRLGVNVSVSGPGIVSGGAIQCGRASQTLFDCEVLFPQGSTVVLRARPGRRSRFVFWSGFCTGRKRTCTLRVTAPKTVQALFRR